MSLTEFCYNGHETFLWNFGGWCYVLVLAVLYLYMCSVRINNDTIWMHYWAAGNCYFCGQNVWKWVKFIVDWLIALYIDSLSYVRCMSRSEGLNYLQRVSTQYLIRCNWEHLTNHYCDKFMHKRCKIIHESKSPEGSITVLWHLCWI